MRFNGDSNASGGEASADYMISEHGRKSEIAKEKDPVTGVVERYDGHSLIFRTNKEEARSKFMGKDL